MKKIIAVLLALVMLLGMAACSKSKESAKAAEPAAPAVTDAPTAAPTNTPAPTEVPADVAVVNALKKLDDLSSMHMDMTMLMDMSLQIAYQGMNMGMPVKVTMNFGIDNQKNPALAKMDTTIDMEMAALGNQNYAALVYVDATGEKPISYSTSDDGVSWTAGSEDMGDFDPQKTIEVLQKNIKEFTKVGADTVDGKSVTVYTGKLDGQYAPEIMAATGMSEMLEEMDMGNGLNDAAGDILVTVSVDDETGYPLYYAMDMTDMLKDALSAAMKEAMGTADLGEAEMNLNVAAITTECTLSQFDSVAPIEIPEAALAAANN